MPFDWLAGIGDARLSVNANRIPNLCEEPVEGNPGRKPGVEDFGVLDHRLQSRGNIGVTRGLAARKSARIAPQVRQMLSNCLRCRQESLRMLPPLTDQSNAPSYSRSTYSPLTPLSQKSSVQGEPSAQSGVLTQPRGQPSPNMGSEFGVEQMNERKPVGQQNQMETAATRNKKANLKPAKLGRDVQARLGQQLRAMYDDVVNQGVPDRFSELINRLNGDEKKDGR